MHSYSSYIATLLLIIILFVSNVSGNPIDLGVMTDGNEVNEGINIYY